MDNRPIPVSIITGFLGSGKTTLLNRLLQSPGLANSLVVINEFGEVGIDHLLVSAPSENMRLLSNGCLCCEVRGDLVETLADAARQRREATVPAFDRVIVETTGLADPVPLVQTVVTDRDVAASYRLDSIITLVDAVNAQVQLDRQPESVKQIAVSDLLLMSKTDIADTEHVGALQERIEAINRSADVIRVTHGEIDPGLLFGRSTIARGATPGQLERWLGEAGCMRDSHEDCAHGHDARHGPWQARHDDRVHTFSVTLDRPATASSLVVWLTMLASFRGANLLRVKGLVNVDDRPMVINAVQSVLHEPFELAQWPSEDRRSRIVFIVRELERDVLERTVDALLTPEAPASDSQLDPEAYAQFLRMARTFM